jgi:signal transduction histidine kinase/transcriptional regulator with GAF, ATPase, and Fis domain
MIQTPPAPVDTLPHYRQFCAELTDARTFQEGIALCLRALEQSFAAVCTPIVWGAHGMWAVVDGGTQPLVLPDADTLRLLANGDVVFDGDQEQPQVCYAPLRARGELLGWFRLERPALAVNLEAFLPLVAGHAGPALSVLAATSRHDERLAQVETLTAVSQQITSMLDLDRLFESIYEAACRVVEAQYFSITLADVALASLSLSYVIVNGERQPSGMLVPAHVGLSNVVLRERVPLTTTDYLHECARHNVEPYLALGVPVARAWLGVPLIARDRVVGVLAVACDRAHYAYTADQITLLSMIAAQAAVSIENARLYQRSSQQARQMATLNRIGRTITSWQDPERVPSVIMHQVTHLLNVDEGSLLLLDEQTGELVFTYTTGPVGQTLLGQRISSRAGLAGYVFTSGESVVANDVQLDQRFDSSTDQSTGYTTRRLLAVALRGVGGSLGVIEVLNRRDNSSFTDEDRRLLEAVADYAVIALDNARRYAQIDQALARRAQELARINDQLQHNLRTLTALNALGMAIQTTLRSADDIYRLTANGVVELSSALGAWVLLQEGSLWRQAVAVGVPVRSSEALVPYLSTLRASSRPSLIDRQLPDILIQAGCRWLLIVPLRATDRLAGCLCVAYSDQPPNAADRETVMLFATQAASAVESMRLFEAVRSARDQMASILASTREGVILVDADRRIALANARLLELCGLEDETSVSRAPLQSFLERWAQHSPMPAEGWAQLRAGIDRAFSRGEAYVTGELTDPNQRLALEWSVIAALSSGNSQGGVLIVMRDISDAKESERLRGDLTNMIVHDLRSPLSSVMASFDMMSRGVTGDLNRSQRHVLKIANDSAEQMLSMINTLLDISRLEAGGMPLQLEEVDVSAIISRATQQLQSLALDRGVQVACDYQVGLPRVFVDPQMIMRVVQNLVANAIKFSSRGTQVRVSVVACDEPDLGGCPHLRVTVRDQGVGIAPQNLAKIFTKFGQVGERRGGTGLGLTFCKLVIEAHGGRIGVESVMHEGSSFFFALPVPAMSGDRTTLTRSLTA